MDAEGRIRESEPIERTSHKVYKGYSFIQREDSQGWSRAGTARISVHRDGSTPIFDGHFRIDGNNHHIQTVAKYFDMKHDEDPDVLIQQEDPEERMVVWRDSDLRGFNEEHMELKRSIAFNNDSTCDAASLSFNSKMDEQYRIANPFYAMDTKSIFARQSIDGGSSGGDSTGDLTASIGSTSGCPTARKVALVGIATDCTYRSKFDSDAALRQSVISMVNQASEVYENTFQISLAIHDLVINDKECPGTPAEGSKWNVACGNGTDIGTRLSLFSEWRGEQKDSNAYWSLLTTCPTDSAVGLAWRGQLCKSGSGTSKDTSGNTETVAGANVVVKTDTEWQVFAHETGHTFGAVHDCSDSTCPATSSTEVCCPLSTSSCNAEGKYIMNPSTGNGITAFSPCSIGNICSGLKGLVDGSCLSDNKNVKTQLGAQCGNGIVEEGEECDCGSDEDCKTNACCDQSTCKFKSGAVCDPTSDDCCDSTCKFKSSSVVCRASIGECDIEEKCPGNGPSCPTDKHKDDGTSCGSSSSGLSCASGLCTSRDLQCQNMASGLGSANNTGACSADTSCSLTCSSPSYGPNECVTYSQNFLDGTSCGAGGHCSGGQCEGSTTAKEIKQWIDNHKPIVIPVACVIGVLLLLAIGSCIINCFRRRRPGTIKSQPTPPQMNSWPGQGYGRGSNWDNGNRGQRGPPPDEFYPPPPPVPSAYSHYQPPPGPPPGHAANEQYRQEQYEREQYHQEQQQQPQQHWGLQRTRSDRWG